MSVVQSSAVYWQLYTIMLPRALKTAIGYSGMGEPATDPRRRRWQLKQRMKSTGSMKGHPLSLAGDLPFFENPRNDNELLLNLQSALKGGKASSWSAFYQLAMKVAKRYVATFAKSTPAVASLDADQRAEKAHDAVVYLCEGYLSDDSFCVTRSITGYLWLRVRAALFNRTKAESIVDYVDISKLARLADVSESE